jgi:autotransporter-associated beta strand protein
MIKLIALFLIATTGLASADSIWRAAGTSSDFNKRRSWAAGQGVPGPLDLAVFAANSHATSPIFTAPTSIGGFVFNPGAPSYTFTSSGNQIVTIGQFGISNNADTTQRFNAPVALGADQTWQTSLTSPLVFGTVNLSTFNLTLTGPGTLAVSGNISGTGSVTSPGAGITTFGATNYSGTTTISAGTLILTGNKTSAGSVFIGANGTLISGGNVGGAITVNGRISPGLSVNSLGSITTGMQNWESGGHYLWDITSATGTAGVDWDLLTMGVLNVNSQVGSTFVIDVSGNAAGFDPNSNISWSIATATGINGFSADKFTIDSSAFTNPHSGTFTLTTSVFGNTVVLNYIAPVPEASTWGIALGGFLFVLVATRQRRRVHGAAI